MDTKVGKPLWMVFKEQEQKRLDKEIADAKAERKAPRPEPIPIVKSEAKPVKRTSKRPSRSQSIKHGAAAKKKKEPKVKLDWTVVSKIYEAKKRGDAPVKNVISHLRYRGKRVHTLRGPLSRETLEQEAKVLNDGKYTPNMSRVKLYCEMTDEDKVKLANQHSPELSFE